MDDTAALESLLVHHALHVRRDEDSERPILVHGNTYAHKQALRSAGGHWDREAQAWRFASEEHVRAAALRMASAPPGLAEAAPGFATHGSKHYHGHRGRLRERFRHVGAEALADYELLELLLFFSIYRRDTKPLAKRMLERFGSLGGVLAAEPERYREIILKDDAPDDRKETFKDDLDFTVVLLKVVRAAFERVLKEQIRERPVVSSWSALIDYLQLVMMHDTSEHFRILFLDRKNILIKDEVQSRGTVDHTPLYPREVVKRALELGACALIMVHNHPSGDPTPSRADIEMTRQVVEALRAVNITLHDHVIVGRNKHTSFKSEALI